MQKSVIRVRGSEGLKFPSELSVKGSARIETDSRATARVDVDEIVNNEGETLAANIAEKDPQASTARTAHTTETKQSHTAKARIFIDSFLKKPI
jgi:hypothetical protein